MHVTKRERGLALPFFAIVLVLLMIMVAFAVDLGSAAEHRRSSQNRADAAALAAALELGTRQAKFADAAGQATAMDEAVDAARTYVEENGGLAVSDPAWASCTDANQLARPSTQSPCISFSTDLTQVRVRVPDESIGYRFASVVGIGEGTVRSSAIAEVVSSVVGSTRPIVLKVGTAGRTCVEAGGQPSTCDGYRLDPGDFGTMNSPRYNLLTNGGDAANFALGLDHQLRLTSTNGTNYCDADGSNVGDENRCSSQTGGLLNNTSATHDLANYVITGQGGQLGDVTRGLIGETSGNNSGRTFTAGGDTVTALLYRPDGADPQTLVPSGNPASPHVNFSANKQGLNGVHISRYLVNGVNSVGCGPGLTPDHATVPLDDPGYDICNVDISNFLVAGSLMASPPVIFSRDILESPRFGVAPVTDTDMNGNSIVARIVDFYGIYIDKIYGNATQVTAIDAFVFPLRMVEPDPTGSGTGLPYVGGPFSVRLIR